MEEQISEAELTDDYLEDESCPTCGSLPDSPDEERCPDCRGCGGIYSPGSEECDWCPDEEICASLGRY